MEPNYIGNLPERCHSVVKSSRDCIAVEGRHFEQL